MFRKHTRRISQPVVAVDDIETQTVSQHTRYRFIVADFFNQVIRIATGEIDTSEVVRTDTAEVIIDAVAVVIVLFRTHLAFHPRFHVVVIDVFPDYRNTVGSDDTQKTLVLVAPWFRDDERDLHVFLLTHAASQSVTRCAQTA